MSLNLCLFPSHHMYYKMTLSNLTLWEESDKSVLDSHNHVLFHLEISITNLIQLQISNMNIKESKYKWCYYQSVYNFMYMYR